MRVALISPYSKGTLRGNVVTVARIAKFLAAAGAEVMVLSADCYSEAYMAGVLADFHPDLIHGFHIRHSGHLVTSLASHFCLPSLITITGTDIHDPQLRTAPETLNTIASVQALVCFGDAEAMLVARFYPDITAKVEVIRQGIEPLPISETADFNLNDSDFVILLPAALRPVKQVETAVKAMPLLRKNNPSLRLVVAGGIIDKLYAESIVSLVNGSEGITLLGEVPHEKMGSLYSRADLVVNCSSSESMSNSIMEAMSLGRPVLASDIPGNRSLINSGENGFLFAGLDDYVSMVEKLAGDDALRGRIGAEGKRMMQAGFSPHREAEQYLDLYASL